MNVKNILKFVLGALIIVFVLITLKLKLGENKAQLAYTGIANKEIDWLERQNKQSANVNSGTARMMSIGAGNLADPANNVTQGKPEQTPLVVIGAYTINPGNFFGCVSKENFHALTSLTAKGDKKTFVKTLNEGVASGESIYFKPGEQVVLEETTYGQKEIRISRKGETKSYWTIAEAIK